MADTLGTQLPITATPLIESGASGTQSLDGQQRAVKIGEMVPIVFGKRVGDAGGVLVSPPATECRFEVYNAFFGGEVRQHVKVYYQLVVSEGQIDRIEVRDVFQQSCRVGTSTTAYNTRSGDWTPGNFLPSDIDAPRFCGNGGTYRDLTTLSFINGIPSEFDQWRKQVHCFVRGGINLQRLLDDQFGSSNNYADLALYLLRKSARLDDAAIDLQSYAVAAQFLQANGFFCDGIIQQNQNMSQWLQDTAALFLLRRSRINGKEALRPLIQTNQDGTINTDFVRWVHTFTNNDISSFNVSYAALTDRKPFSALMIWRQQPSDDIGLVRTTEVRYFGTADAGPFEQHDLSQYVTNENHAIKIGAYILGRRRYIEHTLELVVTPGSFNGSLSVGDIIRVNYVTTDNKGQVLNHDYLYEIDNIGKSFSGEIQLELVHFPVDSEGRSLIALDVARAQGSGILLPTGREAVSCDFNDPSDDSFWPEFPTPDWDLNFDIDFDFGFDVPIGFGDWTFDADTGDWSVDGNLDPDFDALFPDGVDLNVALPNLSRWISGSAGAPTLSIEDLQVRYKYQNFALWQESDYSLVWGKLVSTVPVISNLRVLVKFADEVFEVIIARNETENIFVLRTSLDQPFFCRNFAVTPTNWSSGGYASITLPAAQAVTVCPYIGTVGTENFSFDPENPDELATVDLTIDERPLATSLIVAISVGREGWFFDIAKDIFVWKGEGAAPPSKPKTYEYEIPGFFRFAGGWEWDAFERQWIPRNPFNPPSGGPPAALPEASTLTKSIEIKLPTDFDKTTDAIRIMYAEGGFTSHRFTGPTLSSPSFNASDAPIYAPGLDGNRLVIYYIDTPPPQSTIEGVTIEDLYPAFSGGGTASYNTVTFQNVKALTAPSASNDSTFPFWLINSPSEVFDFGSDPFTIEFWWRAYDTIVSAGDAFSFVELNLGRTSYADQSGELYVLLEYEGRQDRGAEILLRDLNVNIGARTSVSNSDASAFNHIVIQRHSELAFTMHYKGSIIYSWDRTSDRSFTGKTSFTIGASNFFATGAGFSQIRMTKGKAIYGTGGFTPPTTAFFTPPA
jgi:hypothetical protein